MWLPKAFGAKHPCPRHGIRGKSASLQGAGGAALCTARRGRSALDPRGPADSEPWTRMFRLVGLGTAALLHM
eukprot:3676323-Alexandrium_andersonii.AAC.1